MTFKELQQLLKEARNQLSSTAIKAMYEKGRQDNPEGEVARNMYKKFTGQDWKADKPSVITPTKKETTSGSSTIDQGLQILKAIFSDIEKAIKLGDDNNMANLGLNQSVLLKGALNRYYEVLAKPVSEKGFAAFIDSLDDELYSSLTNLFDAGSDIDYSKKKFNSTSPFAKSFNKIKKQFITEESSTTNSDVGKFLKQIFNYIDEAMYSEFANDPLEDDDNEFISEKLKIALKIYRVNRVIDKLDSMDDKDNLNDIMQEIIDMLNNDTQFFMDSFAKSYKNLKIKFQKYMK
jgi:hypothetical protein